MPDIHSAQRTADTLATHFATRPVTLRQALTVITERRLRTALTRGTVVRLRRGTFAVAERSDLGRYRQRIAASLAARPTSVASHESALALWGLSLPWFGDPWNGHPVRLTSATGGRVRRAGLVVTQRPLPPGHVAATPWGPVTSPQRTAVDLAREVPFVSALISADECCGLALLAEHGWTDGLPAARRSGSFLRRVMAEQTSGWSVECLAAVLTDAPLRHGRRRAQRVIDSVDPASESPGESYSRAHLLSAGLPRPVAGLKVRGDDGARYYADLAWPELGVLAEVDGYGKYEKDNWKEFRREKRREDSLRAAGWTMVRWSVAEVLQDPARVVARVRRALSVARGSELSS